MTILTIILSIITALLGGTNIWQAFQISALKRKANAEAYQTEIDALRKIIATNVAEIARLNAAYADLQTKYFDLNKEMAQKIKTTKKV